jgi:circadian clock protein KaiC
VANADLVQSISPPTDKVSIGVHALDEMLYGGILRGSATMITGAPGTAKTTLSGAFAEAAAKRGERTLYIAYDESCEEIVRNLTSVNIHLQEQLDLGTLKMHSENAASGGAEEHFQHIKTLIQSYQATCLVIDPFTAISNAGNLASTQAVAARLVRWVKSRGITMVCTSLPSLGDAEFAGTILKITTVADTWIYLTFSNSGERNRGLTILKSRGTNHSNQLRELILSSSGITIAAPYTEGGTVLMGTLRWQKERDKGEERDRLTNEFERQNTVMDDELAELDSRVQSLQRTIAEKRLARRSIVEAEELRQKDEGVRQFSMIQRRQSKELGSAEAILPSEENR